MLAVSRNFLVLQFQHQVEFAENSVIAMTDYSYSFHSGDYTFNSWA